MDFEELGLSPSLVAALELQKLKEAYPIQAQVIPAVLERKDVLGIAKTGSGKTLSYVLPLLVNLQGNTEAKNRHVNALVLVPTRELAQQVQDVFSNYSKVLPRKIKSLAVYGGVSINPQMMNLQNVNVLIATPGRLLELTASNAVHLSSIDVLVLDEADKMLNLGFSEEMDQVFSLLPRKRQNLLFSATLSEQLATLNKVLLHNPVIIKIEDEESDLSLITQTGYFVEEEKKGPLLRYLIRTQNMKQVLVFTSSSYEADKVSDKLRKNGIDASAIHGKKSQGARTEALSKFKKGTLRVLVATDLLARGIDIKFLGHVINYELPRSPKDFIHRIGRTGRAGAQGEAISFVTPADNHHFKIIQKKMGRWVTMIDASNFDLQDH